MPGGRGSDRRPAQDAEPHRRLRTIGRHCGQWRARNFTGTGGYGVRDRGSAMVDRPPPRSQASESPGPLLGTDKQSVDVAGGWTKCLRRPVTENGVSDRTDLADMLR